MTLENRSPCLEGEENVDTNPPLLTGYHTPQGDNPLKSVERFDQ